MAATSSPNQIAGEGGGADGTSQAVQTEIQYKRDLHYTAGPFWHLRYRRAVRFAKVTPKRKHTTPRP